MYAARLMDPLKQLCSDSFIIKRPIVWLFSNNNRVCSIEYMCLHFKCAIYYVYQISIKDIAKKFFKNCFTSQMVTKPTLNKFKPQQLRFKNSKFKILANNYVKHVNT